MALKFDEKIIRLAETEANIERIRNVEKCFGNDGSNRLLEPGRVLVGEGVLLKMCRKKPKPRYFFLFNDVLVYGTSVIDKKKYINQHTIPLNDVQIKAIPDGDDQKLRNGWLILSPKKSFCVYASTPKEKTEWINHITNCIDKLTNGKTKKNSLNDIAPQWIPDRNADTCMRCNKAKFTVVNRRHHCRKCGFVVCSDCSKNKFLIKTQSTEPVRVCDVCYVTLTSDKDMGHTDTSGDSDSESDINRTSNQQPQFYDD